MSKLPMAVSSQCFANFHKDDDIRLCMFTVKADNK
jgi:hypothetical protein